MKKNSSIMNLINKLKNNYKIVKTYNIFYKIIFSKNPITTVIKKREQLEDKKYEVYRDGNNETFFGYYDKSPVNRTGEFIVFYSTKHSTKKRANPKKSIRLIIKNRITKEVIYVDKIFAYNWQQGSKVQWIKDDEIIYNNYDSKTNRYISIIYNIRNQKKQILDYPIYEASDSFALSLNFIRLAKYRPDYGYFNIKERQLPPLDKDGIFFINYEKRTQTLLISIAQLDKEFPIGAFNIIAEKVNHIMLSKDRSRFIFLHRYFVGNMQNKYDRLFMYEIKEKKLTLLHSSKMISHYSWIDNETIISYMKYNGLDDYYVIDTDKKRVRKTDLNNIIRYGDGHPTQRSNLILTDSYPDKSFHQHLIVYDINKKKILHNIALYHNVFFYGQCRCDIHPKWSTIDKEIFFDSVFSGKRHLYSIKL